MAVKFLEPGGDADFGTNLWSAIVGAPAVATDFLNGGHVKSLKFRVNVQDEVDANGLLADAGGSISVFIYLNALPSATCTLFATNNNTANQTIIRVRLTSGGILQLFNNTVQIGTNGSTLATGTWYRLCLTWNITSLTVNTVKFYKGSLIDISVTNSTLSFTGSTQARFGNISANLTLDLRMSDFYIDNVTTNTDPGNVWVTAKRPNANGTTNGFATQIGAGGSGYGTGHSPQVNERTLSTTNGWSMIGAGSAVTEEYNVEGASVGDIDISAGTIVDLMGWLYTSALVAESASVILIGTSSTISVTPTNSTITKIAGVTVYPPGTGADIGEVTTTALTTVSLYECGIVVAYIPGVVTAGTTGIMTTRRGWWGDL